MGSFSAHAREIVRAEFTSTPIPEQIEALESPYTRSAIRVFYDDQSSKEIFLNYKELFRSGDRIEESYAGAVIDSRGNTITDWGSAQLPFRIRKGPIFSSAPDGNTFLRIPKKVSSDSGSLFLVTHFEFHSWVENEDKSLPPFKSKYFAPMTINLTTLEQDTNNGQLTAKHLRNIDSSNVQGFWVPCAASRTPWNTHLGSEETEPNARWFENKSLENINLYLGTPKKTVKEGGANPYRYGFPIEIQVDSEGKTQVFKRYAMGRISLELGIVMPDERTVYLSDDAVDGIRLMFIADRKKDLTSGTLYAAKWFQTKAFGGGEADLGWIKLGHTEEETIREFLNQRITFSDIFDWKKNKSFMVSPASSEGFRPIYVDQGYTPKIENPQKKPSTDLSVNGKAMLLEKPLQILLDPKIEYLKIKPEMETAAAFLETRRFAALRGATAEFTKLEGQAFNRKDGKLYTALSKAYEGMLAGKNEARFQDDIQLTGNLEDLDCGLIYESDLGGNRVDTEGNPIPSDWVAINMKALLVGKGDGKGSCDSNLIANPDGLEYSDSLRTLFIGEDSNKKHMADFLWAYSIDSGQLSRILVAPRDSEVSGLFLVEDLNGFAYLFSNFQRDIFPETFWEKMTPGIANKHVAERDLRGIVGYLGPIPMEAK